ncbi:MAG: polysaccharide deacetylase family protein [bacterium]
MILDIWNDLRKKSFRILMFHSIADNSSYQFSTPPETFYRMMRYLADNSFKVLPLERALAEGDGKTAVITFDDAYTDNLETAAPILAEFAFKATFFVPTALVGQTNTWENDAHGQSLAILDWEGLDRLRELGHEIGAHTASHVNLREVIDKATLEWEIDYPFKALRSKLGIKRVSLAYPYGQQNPVIRKRAEKVGYYAGIIAGGFWGNPPGIDPFLLRREGITRLTGLDDFAAMVEGAANPRYLKFGYRYFIESFAGGGNK